MPLPQILESLAISDKCVSQSTAVTERGRRFAIDRQPGDIIWCIRVDDCWLDSAAGKRVDYLFYGSARSGKECLSLVELKGSDFGAALEQIEGTVKHLYNIKAELRQFAAAGRLTAYVVLSKGKGVPQRLKERRRIEKKYHIIVTPKGQQCELEKGAEQMC